MKSQHRLSPTAHKMGPIRRSTNEKRIGIFRAPQSLRLLIAASVIAIGGNGAVADQKPLKVFILAGQSNMQGHAQVRTFEQIGMDPKTEPLLREMQGDDGTPQVCQNVWISSLSTDSVKQGRLTAGFGARDDKIGPEFTFGITMHKMQGEPILIIKTAWGGKSLHTDFRPPSAGSYAFKDTQIERFEKQGKDIEAIKAGKVEATGHYYRLTIDHVKEVLADISRVYPDYDPGQGHELAGFVWFQGWNDMVDSGTYPNRDKAGGYDEYSEALAHFIRDVRKDLSAPTLPFVIGVMGVGGPVERYSPDQQRHKEVHQNFRMAMAAPADLPEFQGNVAIVLTENFWDLELNDLTARDEKIKKRAKTLQSERKLDGKETQAVLEELRQEEFSERERQTLEDAISNFAFHYLGSAKIMAQIGKGFAEALVGTQDN